MTISRFIVIAGCRVHNVKRNQIAVLQEILENGPDFGHTVTIIVYINGQRHAYTVRHKNRLKDKQFNAHKGNPLEKVTFSAC
jgi:hypothetical protein